MTKPKNTKKAEWDTRHTHVALKKETVSRLERLGRYKETKDDIVSRLITTLEEKGKGEKNGLEKSKFTQRGNENCQNGAL